MPEGHSQSPKDLENLDEAPDLTAGGSYSGEPESDHLSAAFHPPGRQASLGPALGCRRTLCRQEVSFSLDGGSWDGGQGG